MPDQKTAVAARKPTVLDRLLAVAKTPEERAKAFAMADSYEQQRAVQEIVAEVRAQSWGNRVSPALRVAITRWALGVGADPLTEIDILGGGPYLRASYWMRLVSAEPDFLRAEEVWLHHDERASEDENARRRELRVQWGVPDGISENLGLKEERKKKEPGITPIKAAVLVLLHFKERGPFAGRKWSPSRANDDVGMDFPEASALTRAWRKAALAGAVRQQPTVTQRMRQLAEIQRATDVPDLGPPPVIEDTSPQLGPGAVTEPVEAAPKPTVVRHNPSARCPREGEHPAAECGYEQQPPAA